jgi:hypothetical protein
MMIGSLSVYLYKPLRMLLHQGGVTRSYYIWYSSFMIVLSTQQDAPSRCELGVGLRLLSYAFQG